jgi:predicted DNA-binding transcriptional regulator AlpA
MALTQSTTLGDVDLVGLTEIADMLGVSRQRVHQLAATEAFPAPEAEVSAGRLWKRAVIEKWAKATGRTIVGEG